MNKTIRLSRVEPAYVDFCQLWPDIKRELINGQQLDLEVRPTVRNLDQNALLHAALSEIAERVEWAGQKRDSETWKRLCTAAWLRTRGESVEVLPAIDGHGIDVVFRRTSKLTKPEMSDLIEYVSAFAAQHEVPA